MILVNLDTGHITSVEATEGGSFEGSIFGPPGTSIQVKSDPFGITQKNLWRVVKIGGETPLAPLPGTIVRVPDPPSSGGGLPFGGAGSADCCTPDLPSCTFQGTINTNQFQPGETLTVDGTLSIVSAALEQVEKIRVNTGLTLERLSGPEGQVGLARNLFMSIFLTPTGFPIERSPAGSGLTAFKDIEITKVAADQAQASVNLSLLIPADLPAGFYRPFIWFLFQEGYPSESPRSRP